MTKKYRILFVGLKGDKEAFKTRMVLFGVQAETVDRMIVEAPIILKGDLTLGDARRYADTVHDAGGKVTIQEDGYFEESRRMNQSVSITPFQDFTMCPECGLKQLKGDICIKCGFSLKTLSGKNNT